MRASEKFCLKWNNFQDNVSTAFGSLREDNHFADVTLASEDGQQVEAHKVILAASSPFFQNLLRRNKHAHPLIYMRGLKSEDLVAIVDFLYYGEANIYQENLNTFLTIAEELNLKGLNRESRENQSDGNCRETPKTSPQRMHGNQMMNKTQLMTNNYSTVLEVEEVMDEAFDMEDTTDTETTVSLQKYNLADDFETQEDKLMQKEDSLEVNAIEGTFVPCDSCGKLFRYVRNRQNAHGPIRDLPSVATEKSCNHYTKLLLAPAEGFGLRLRMFWPFRKKALYAVFAHFRQFFV